MRAVIIFDNFGPYHKARLEAGARLCDLLGVQVNASSAEYAWAGGGGETGFRTVTLFNNQTSQTNRGSEMMKCVAAVLADFKPAVVFLPGWSSAAAFAALRWCLSNRACCVMMSESTAFDERRVFWKEWVKRRVVGLCSAALVGGQPQAAYLERLGVPRDRIFQGYDAVDNDYFVRGAEEAGAQASVMRNRHGLPENYFLASARFIEKKNLSRLVEAYARYRELACNSALRVPHSAIWNLVLLGDGPLRKTLNSQISTLNLQGHVLMPGFKQYFELSIYYGLASAFVHASTTEQWGLVVNEAMASGLPVLVSNRCGCAIDLVKDGVNGFRFDPHCSETLAQEMLNLFKLPPSQLAAMGKESQRIISEWGPRRFGEGFKQAAQVAINSPRKKTRVFDGFLLSRLLRR